MSDFLEEPVNNKNKWLITLTIMLVALLEILDTTIVNVSLPQIMGSLSVNLDKITWILTSYIVAAAIVMPLTGFLITRLGCKKLLLINIMGFMISSMLCGLANSLLTMVFFRSLQGVFGASLVPLSQFILRKIFPPEEQGTAMAIWGIGIMAAPVFGPTIGGLITEYLSWRWVFYINFPLCLISYFLSLKLISETPVKQQTIDWLGLIFMAIGIGSLQILLDRGNSVSWFDASSSWWLLSGAIFGNLLFIYRSLSISAPIVNLSVFKNKNFALSTFLMMWFVLSCMGQISLSPLMLQNLLNYPSLTAGYAMAPRGISSMISMAIAGRLINRYDSRWLLVIAIFFVILGTHEMAYFTIDMSYRSYFFASCLQGLGMGMFVVPLATLSMSQLSGDELASGSGLFGLSRNLGQAFGISITTAFLSRLTQFNWNTLSGYINSFNPNLFRWENTTHLYLSNPVNLRIIAEKLSAQAQMIAFNDTAYLASYSLLFALPFIFMLKKPKVIAKTNMEIH